jgi:hypothetical protein
MKKATLTQMIDIVVPSYLPDEDNHNETRYNLTSSNLADTVYELFIFEYFSDNYSKSFTISEQKIPVDTTINIVDIPETENDSIISYNGVEIWEEGFEIRKFYRYTWLHNNVWYSAWFDGYTRDESRATIKSMLD